MSFLEPDSPVKDAEPTHGILRPRVLAVLVLVLIISGIFLWRIRLSSSTISGGYIRWVTSATLTCTGTCNIVATLNDSYGQKININQLGAGNWTITRPSGGAGWWRVNWNVQVGNDSKVILTWNCISVTRLGCPYPQNIIEGPGVVYGGEQVVDPIT